MFREQRYEIILKRQRDAGDFYQRCDGKGLATVVKRIGGGGKFYA